MKADLESWTLARCSPLPMATDYFYYFKIPHSSQVQLPLSSPLHHPRSNPLPYCPPTLNNIHPQHNCCRRINIQQTQGDKEGEWERVMGRVGRAGGEWRRQRLNQIYIDQYLQPMAKRTKKVGVTGKYGTRYGGAIRKIVKKFELQQHAKYQCPPCGKNSVRRLSCGIWKCKACKITFAGGAFEFATSVATTAKVTMNRLMKLKDDVKAQEAKEKLEKQEKQQEKKEKKEKKDKKK